MPERSPTDIAATTHVGFPPSPEISVAPVAEAWDPASSPMAPREYAPVVPAVLRWARETAGYSVEDVAGKLNVSLGRVLAWESGQTPLPVGRLDQLASIYKRPTAVLYMPSPPVDTHLVPRDFRNQPSGLDPRLIYQIRLADERRNSAIDLLEELNEKAPPLAFVCHLDEDAADVGARLRQVLRVSIETQREWSKDRSGYTAFNAWKDEVERIGVLVCQASRRDMAGARGFSVHADLLPVIVVSSDDTVRGRIFTLMHELVHLGLREGGLCDFHDDGVEGFCNRVAADALMPEESLRQMVESMRDLRRDGAWSDSALQTLASAFSVSQHALILRLVELGEATRAFYRTKLPELLARAPQTGGFVPPHVMAMANNGRQFTRIVVEAYDRGVITEHRASTYLHLSHEHLPKVAEETHLHFLKRAS